MLFIRKFFHTPRGLEATGYKVHWNEHANLEPIDELSATECITVTYAPVYGEHHKVETVSDLADVLQLTKEPFLVGYGINILFKFLTVDGLTWYGVWQEPRIPVTQVTGMEDTFPLSLDNPRHSTVGATHRLDRDPFISP